MHTLRVDQITIDRSKTAITYIYIYLKKGNISNVYRWEVLKVGLVWWIMNEQADSPAA